MAITIESSSRSDHRWGRTTVATAVIVLLAGAMFFSQVLPEKATPANPRITQMRSGEAIVIKDEILARQATVSASGTATGNGDVILFKDELQTTPAQLAKPLSVTFAEKDRIESDARSNR